MSAKKGKLFVISGPAGSGKGTVMNILTQRNDSFSLSVSLTSRPMLAGEVEGVNYYYVTREQFEQKIKCGDVLEYTEYCGNYYGTPKAPAENAIANGIDTNRNERIPDKFLAQSVPTDGIADQVQNKTADGRGNLKPMVQKER